jgi:hypothetical protein
MYLDMVGGRLDLEGHQEDIPYESFLLISEIHSSEGEWSGLSFILSQIFIKHMIL